MLFRIPTSRVLNSIFVNPLFSEFENSKLSGLLVIVVSLTISAWLFLNGGRKFLLVLSSIITVFYAFQRYNDFWEFQKLSQFNGLYIWDIVFIGLSLPAFKYFLKGPHNPSLGNDSRGFIEDLPINSTEEDTFNRREVAKKIAQTILLTTNKQSFAIGILGEYGSGKTSFIKLIETYLDYGQIEKLSFNPWNTDATPDIQKDFFDLLAGRLYEINPKLSELVLDYSRKLSRIDSSVEKLIKQWSFIRKVFHPQNSIDDYERINQLLKNSGKKIIVTIDDLDRLYNHEVIEVLKLIRNTASFGNIFYLVAYDKTYVQEAIKTLNQKATYSYIDKIIQLEIPLPKRESDDLLDLMITHLQSFISEADLSILNDEIIKYGFKNHFNFSYSNIFRQSRDVIKFINTFKITYSLLNDEVLFDNLFVLELVKFRFPLVYDMLFEQTDLILYLSPRRASYEEFYELRVFKEADTDKPVIIKTLREQNYSESDITLICGLLFSLYSHFDRPKNAKNSIIYPMYMERYFRYRISAKEISEFKYQKAFTSGLEEFKLFIDECLLRRLHSEIGARLFQEKTQTRALFEFKLKAIFYLGPKFISAKGNTSFDHVAISNMLYNHQNRLTDKFYPGQEDQYKIFIKELFDNAPFPYLFHNELIYHVKDDSLELPLNVEELTKYQIDYFCKHVNNAGLTKDAIWLMWGCRQNYYLAGNKHWRFEPSLVPHIREFIKTTNPVEFLKTSIKPETWSKNSYAIHLEILNIFNDREEFRTIISDHALIDHEVKSEFLNFYDLCKAQDFSRWVKFEFHTILKPKRDTYTND